MKNSNEIVFQQIIQEYQSHHPKATRPKNKKTKKKRKLPHSAQLIDLNKFCFMKMKDSAMLLTTMALMLGGSGLGAPLMPAEVPKRRRIVPPLGSYKHTGEIPKGCVVETVTLTFSRNDYVFSKDADILYGSDKAKLKRITLYQKEMASYLHSLTVDEIISRNEFTIIAEPFSKIKLPLTPFIKT